MPFPMFSFEPPSEEEKAEMEREELKMEEFRHASQRLFIELDAEQLRSLKFMFHAIAVSDHSPLAASWEGMAAMALRMRFGVCIACGVNHDEEITHTGGLPVTFGQDWKERYGKHFGQTIIKEQDKSSDEPLPNFREITPDERELMNEYHLDDLRIEGTNELIGFVCTGINGMNQPCGMRYPTIEDRMLKDPEECSGCFMRMGHG